MPIYSYKAYDRQGVEQSGLSEAGGESEAREKLRAQGLLPFELQPAGADDGVGETGGNASFSLADRARFARQVGALLRGGVPLARAIAGMETQEAWSHRRLVLSALREGIEGGRDLSTVLSDLGEVFDPWSRSVIRVGETTGRLDTAFTELSTHLTREMEHRRRLIAALTYPVIMAIVACGVLTFLLVYLLPMIRTIFADMRGRLPLITRVLIAASDFLRDWGLWTVGGAGVALLIGRTLFRTAEARRQFEQFRRALPLVGPFFAGLQIESWSRNTAMMLRCGVPLLEAVRVGKACSDSVLERDLLEIVEVGLVKGLPLSQALKGAPEIPAMLIQMVEAGEASGDLAGMLAMVAGEFEAESAVRVEVMMNLLEPLLIVVMGVVVGGIMVGVLLPIYEMNRLL